MIRDHIFISYRRSDVPEGVEDLHEALAKRFGEAAVFRDTQIPLGVQYPQRLLNELGRAAFVEGRKNLCKDRTRFS